MLMWGAIVGASIAVGGVVLEHTDNLGTDPSRDGYFDRALPSPVDALAGMSSSQKRLVNGLGMELVLIPPGEFVMGSPSWEDCRRPEERPHRVRLTRGIYLGAKEVSAAQFLCFVKETGYMTAARADPSVIRGGGPSAMAPLALQLNTDFSYSPNHPAVNVTWDDACAFCGWLSRKEGRRYRLPTEAEWEYACRAGTNTAFWCGDNAASFAFSEHVRPDGIYQSNSSSHVDAVAAVEKHGLATPLEIGSGAANPLGLYDMHGNIQEWCADWYGAAYYRESPVRDPHGPASGEFRVVRGGAFCMYAPRGRSAARSYDPPNSCSCAVGFRVAVDSTEGPW